jgi:calcium binding protein 39
LSAKEETIFAALKGWVVSCAPREAVADADPHRYENADVALNTGMILRAMLRHEPLARILLYSDKCVCAVAQVSGERL